MHPKAGLAAAGWLEETARRAGKDLTWDIPECGHEEPCRCDVAPGRACDRCDGWLGTDCHCWDGALNFARAFLGQESPQEAESGA